MEQAKRTSSEAFSDTASGSGVPQAAGMAVPRAMSDLPDAKRLRQHVEGDDEEGSQGSSGASRRKPQQKSAGQGPKKKKLNLKSECIEPPVFYTADGLRCIRPYMFRFVSYVKQRWLGKRIIDVFREEFRAEPLEYYEKAILDGRIRVDNTAVLPTHVLGESECITHQSHRHEPPVTARPIHVVAETEAAVVVDKPATIPVHVAGKYNFNTLIEILKRERGYTTLYACHRLDRLTSGVTILAKTSQEAAKMHELITTHQVEKTYICKVEGVFPEEEITCSEPLGILSHRLGLCCVSPTGKTAETKFARVSTDGSTSIVMCTPKTGRLHQIRIHLQFLGYPIENDVVYNSRLWGPEKGKGGLTQEQQRQVVERFSGATAQDDEVHGFGAEQGTAKEPAAEDAEVEGKIDLDELLLPKLSEPEESQAASDAASASSGAANAKVPYCLECHRRRTLLDPAACIYLHAWRYRSEHWEYTTGFPEWVPKPHYEEAGL